MMINPTSEADDWIVDLVVPKGRWAEFEEWREDMALPAGHVWFSGGLVYHVQFEALAERQAILFKLMWA